MNKQKWTHLSGNGKRTTIGVLHSPKLGHLLIYCGQKVVIAERNVFESKNFSFFLEEVLLRLKVIKTDAGFNYDFEIAKDVDTPLNLEKKAYDKKMIWQGALALIGVLAFVAIVIGGGTLWHRHYLKKERETNGAFTTATITITPKPSSFQVSYVYGVKDRTFFYTIEYYAEPHPIAPNGFPIYEQDQFRVRYALQNPENHDLLFNEPTPHQLKVYQQRVQQVHQNIHPNLTDSSYCACLLEIAYDIKKLGGYLDFYHQKTPPSKNKKHNMKTYLELVNSGDFKNKSLKCISMALDED